MKKKNALFVDSTKGSSDNIGMVVEVNKVLLREDETFHCEMSIGLDQTLESQQLVLEDDIYTGIYWLNHQQDFQIKFIIKDGSGNKLFSSETRNAKASYAYISEWQPRGLIFEESSEVDVEEFEELDLEKPEPMDSEPIKKIFVEPKPLANDKLGSLISKWGL